MKVNDLTKISSFPLRIVAELTSECNLSCPMCPRHYLEDGLNGTMSEILWKRIIDEVAEESPESIILPFWRGESLLHPQFPEFIKYAVDRSLKVHISTNGQILTKEISEVLSLCEFVTFSIHTPLGFTHAKEFLSNKRDVKPVTQISFVKGEKTTEKLLHDLTTLSDLGGFDSIRLYEEHTKDGVFGKSSLLLDSPRIFCQKLMDTLVIAFDGSVSRCNHIWQSEEKVNLNDMKIKEIWESDYLKQIRNAYPDTYCGACDQWIGHTCGEAWRRVNGKVEHTILGSKIYKEIYE